MAFLLRQGKGKGIALYTRCEDVLLAKAELLLLKERTKKDSRYDGKPIYGVFDVDPTFSISEFKKAYRGDSVGYRRLMELRQVILTEGWKYPEIQVTGGEVNDD